MIRFVSITITIITAFAIIGCEQFSTSYQRVDESEFRMLKYIWEPADAAPGDTITLTCVFAGKRLDLRNDMDWWVSFNVIRDIVGNTTVADTMPLGMHLVSDPIVGTDPRWPHAQSIEYKFRVPPDIVRNSKSIPEDWADALPAEMRNALPLSLASLTKTRIIDMIESSYDNPNLISGEFAKALIPALQYFTVPMRVFTTLQESSRLPHTIVSTQNIRYNSRFKDTNAGIPVNNIPEVDRVVVYRVKGSDVSSIDDKSGLTLDSVILDNSGKSVIPVADGYSYFLDAISHPIDSTVTMGENKIAEKHRIRRQFQLDKDETDGVPHSKFMDVNNLSGKITMPTDKKIKHFVFWLTVYDEALNERLRPNGETLVEVSGRLEYK